MSRAMSAYACRVSAVATCLSVGLLVALPRGNTVGDEKFSPAFEEAYNARRARALSEIQQLGDHDWAGTYTSGGGTGPAIYLVVAPHTGFTYERKGCLGLMDRNCGDVSLVDDELHLTCVLDNDETDGRGIATSLVIVRWDDRRYLVPRGEIIDFCNAVNQLREPRATRVGMQLLRDGDEGKVARGVPIVPAAFHDYLLSSPIEATVIEVAPAVHRQVGSTDVCDFRVGVDVGKSARLQVGMELFVTSPQQVFDWVKITVSEDTRSVGIMTLVDCRGQPPSIGWRLSTRPGWRSSN